MPVTALAARAAPQLQAQPVSRPRPRAACRGVTDVIDLRQQRCSGRRALPTAVAAAATPASCSGAGPVSAPAQAAHGHRYAAYRPLQHSSKGRRLSVVAQAGPGGNWSDRNQRKVDNQILIGSGLGLTLLVLLALRLGSTEAFQSAAAFDWTAGDVSFGLGDALGGLLWAASLYFCSPLQLLLLFFGFIETERPSDWVLRRLGLATGQPVDAIDYRAPAALAAATVSFFIASGLGLAWTLQALLGDATWSVSTGLGSLFAAGMYEVGRPRRLTVEQAQEKERQWQDFARFADARLQRSGRCHETEVVKALQRELPQFRREGALEGATLRQLVRNWAPDAERSSAGYYKGLSLLPAGGAPVPPRASSAAPPSSSSAGSADSSTDQY